MFRIYLDLVWPGVRSESIASWRRNGWTLALPKFWFPSARPAYPSGGHPHILEVGTGSVRKGALEGLGCWAGRRKRIGKSSRIPRDPGTGRRRVRVTVSQGPGAECQEAVSSLSERLGRQLREKKLLNYICLLGEKEFELI